MTHKGWRVVKPQHNQSIRKYNKDVDISYKVNKWTQELIQSDPHLAPMCICKEVFHINHEDMFS